jgi:hypothetical protein
MQVVGPIAYEFSVWVQKETATIEALLTLESSAVVTLLAHVDPRRDVVVLLHNDQ